MTAMGQSIRQDEQQIPDSSTLKVLLPPTPMYCISNAYQREVFCHQVQASRVHELCHRTDAPIGESTNPDSSKLEVFNTRLAPTPMHCIGIAYQSEVFCHLWRVYSTKRQELHAEHQQTVHQQAPRCTCTATHSPWHGTAQHAGVIAYERLPVES